MSWHLVYQGKHADLVHDVEVLVSHRPGISLVSADALSRLHKAERYRSILEELGVLEG